MGVEYKHMYYIDHVNLLIPIRDDHNQSTCCYLLILTIKINKIHFLVKSINQKYNVSFNKNDKTSDVMKDVESRFDLMPNTFILTFND